MDDSDGALPPQEPEPDGGGGGAAFSNVGNFLRALAVLIGAIGTLVIALTQAGVIDGDDEETAGTGGDTTTTAAASLFASVTRPTGRVYFDERTMYVRASEPGRPFLHLADLESPLRDVRLSARISWVSGARDYGTGFVCRYENAANYYLVSVLSGGRYNIVRYRDGTRASLVGRIQQTGALTDEANDVAVSCVGADPTTLTLTANGTTVREVADDDGLEAGNVGVRVGSAESWVTCRFDGLALRSLD